MELREDSARSPLVGVLQDILKVHLNSYEFLPKLRPERLEALVTRRGSMIHIYSKQLTLDL
ncbi:hypothetical protein BCR42DRAFT_440652 [Absidia repens]|uniref:Uncharacterized protein n=1 Tax=Absidia repens TaxID=90262 RepID=A0A1X2IA26_9FUNG|nr:hypothetical protein BCR42DRAFT_440652 [Absidia repens]